MEGDSELFFSILSSFANCLQLAHILLLYVTQQTDDLHVIELVANEQQTDANSEVKV